MEAMAENTVAESFEKLISPQMNVASLLATTSSASAKRRFSLDNRSHSSEATSHLYRFGHEATNDGIMLLSKSAKGLPNSITSLGQLSLSSTVPLSSSLGQSSVFTGGDSIAPSLSASSSVTSEAIPRPSSSVPGKNMRVVSGSQFRLIHKGMPMRGCEHCEQWERTHRKDKETIRSLKLQLARLQESFHDLKYTKNTDSMASSYAAVKFSPLNPAVEKSLEDTPLEDPEAQRRLQALDEELAKTKRLLNFERGASDALRQSLEEQKNFCASETSRLGRELERLNAELYMARMQCNKLRTEHDSLSVKFSDSERELQFCRNKLNDALLRLQAAQERLKGHDEDNIDSLRELQRVRAGMTEAQNEVQHLQHQLSMKTMALAQAEEQLAALGQQLLGAEQAGAKVNQELQDCQAALRSCQEALAAAKKRCDVLEGTLKVTIQERDAAKQSLTEQTQELNQALSKVQTLEAEVLSLQQRLNDTMRRMTVESANTKKALEKAITASVRLCVVAPTVNVNVSDQKNKFKARLSEKALRHFLESEVFEKYSFLFKQGQENSSPTEESMEQWLQRMLGQMQTTIEAHVNSAMDGSSL